MSYLVDTKENIIGKTVLVIKIKGKPGHASEQGVVTSLDPSGKIFGTWGDYPIRLEDDDFRILD